MEEMNELKNVKNQRLTEFEKMEITRMHEKN